MGKTYTEISQNLIFGIFLELDYPSKSKLNTLILENLDHIIHACSTDTVSH